MSVLKVILTMLLLALSLVSFPDEVPATGMSQKNMNKPEWILDNQLYQVYTNVSSETYPLQTDLSMGKGTGSAGYYWIGFTDKQFTPHTIHHPETFLSQRSVMRRKNQGIVIENSDLPVSPAYLDSLAKDHRVQIRYSSRWLNGAVILLSDGDALPDLQNYPFVSDTRLLKPYPDTDKHLTGTETIISNIDYEPLNTQITQLNGHHLHEKGMRGEGIMIAVFDAGFKDVNTLNGFADLRYSGRLAGIKDFVDHDADIFSQHPHGTYVLSVMTADIPGELIGTAPGAYYWLFRTEDTSSEYMIEEYNWLAAAEFADSIGADIINSSLGYTTFDDPSQNYFYPDMDGNTTVVAKAAGKASQRGMLVVNSAGNYGQQEWKYIGSPADNEYVLSVGAVDRFGEKVPFSSIGPTADNRIKPDVMAMGRDVVLAGLNNTTVYGSGTSFSAPIIAGLAACLWQEHRYLSSIELKKAIIKSAHNYNAANNFIGHGIPDFKMASENLQQMLDNSKLTINPNPANRASSIRFYSDTDQIIQVELFNLKGQKIAHTKEISVSQGYNTIFPLLDHEFQTNGFYIIHLTSNDQRHSVKCLITN